MNKKKQVIIISSVATLTLISGVVFLKVTRADGIDFKRANIIQAFEEAPYKGANDTYDDNGYTYIPPVPVTETKVEENNSNNAIEEPFVPATEMDLDPTSITVYVNKEYALPKSYKPEKLVTPNVKFNLVKYDERTLMRPEAASALEELFEGAQGDGIILYGISAFRSYDRQYKIFTNNIVKKGKTYTLRYSAVPGTSEHQTGLAIDVSSKSSSFKLSTNFASTKEGIWLAENAHNYGYIIRYPKGYEEITGYAYEPWHIRYVGKALASYLHENNLTLDEYYKYSPSPGFDFEALYADMINYVPPVVSKIPVEEDDIIVDEDGNVIGDEPDNDLPEDEIIEDITGDDAVDDDTQPEDDNMNDTPKDDPSKGTSDVLEEETDVDTDTEETDYQEPEASVTPSVTPALDITPTPTITPTPIAGMSNRETTTVPPSDKNINE